jgi:hypothetical protein
MRQFRLIVFIAAVATAIALPVAATSAPGDQVRGPACGDITLWDDIQAGPPAYNSRLTGTATVYASVTTAKPSCARATYTISVYDASGTTLLTSQTYSGDDVTSTFQFTYSPPGAPSQVCIAATSNRDGKVIDEAPNGGGCYVLALDFSPGGSGLN